MSSTQEMNGEIIENMHTDNRVDQNGLNTKHTKIGDGPFSLLNPAVYFWEFLEVRCPDASWENKFSASAGIERKICRTSMMRLWIQALGHNLNRVFYKMERISIEGCCAKIKVIKTTNQNLRKMGPSGTRA